MRTKNLTLIFCVFAVFSFQAQSNKYKLDNEIEKWKKELILTGDLGNPCNYSSAAQWREDNPGQTFGITDDLVIEKIDFNNDGMIDAFVSMSVEACNGGNAISSDFSVLIFSHNGEYYKDVNLTKRIEQKISSELMKAGIYSIWKFSTSLNSFDKTINGKSYVWIDEDASCCPSYSVVFYYNPKTKKIKSEITEE